MKVVPDGAHTRRILVLSKDDREALIDVIADVAVVVTVVIRAVNRDVVCLYRGCHERAHFLAEHRRCCPVVRTWVVRSDRAEDGVRTVAEQGVHLRVQVRLLEAREARALHLTQV